MKTGEWLLLWFDVYAKNSVRKNTLQGYKRIINKHLIPGIGNVPLNELKGLDIRKYLNSKIDTGEIKDGGKHHLAVLKMALEQAVIDEEIAKNPANSVKKLKTEIQEFIPWTPAETEKFLQSMKSNRHYPLYLLAWVTGMRRSELLGLQWPDVDFKRNLLNVRRSLVKIKGGYEINEPKTKLSRRKITLPEKIMPVLEEHLKKQTEESRYKVGYNPLQFVFCNQSGTPYSPDHISHKFSEDVERAGLRKIRFYDLRHGHATHLLELGEDIKVIADRLGHSTIMLTGDTYTHVQHEIQVNVASKINDSINI